MSVPYINPGDTFSIVQTIKCAMPWPFGFIHREYKIKYEFFYASRGDSLVRFTITEKKSGQREDYGPFWMTLRNPLPPEPEGGWD